MSHSILQCKVSSFGAKLVSLSVNLPSTKFSHMPVAEKIYVNKGVTRLLPQCEKVIFCGPSWIHPWRALLPYVGSCERDLCLKRFDDSPSETTAGLRVLTRDKLAITLNMI